MNFPEEINGAYNIKGTPGDFFQINPGYKKSKLRLIASAKVNKIT